MKKLAAILVLIAMCLGPVGSHAQSSELVQTIQKGAALYKAKRYAEALPFYKKAVELAERTLGPQHPTTATHIRSLARLHIAQGNYAQAEQLYQRALVIYEKVLGPERRELAKSPSEKFMKEHNSG